MATTEPYWDYYTSIASTDSFDNPIIESVEDDGGWFRIPPWVPQQFQFVGNLIVRPILSCLGVFGNVLSIYVLSKDPKNKNQSIFVYLIGLMSFDIAILIVAMLVSIYDIKEYINPTFGIQSRIYVQFVRSYFAVVMKHMTALLLIIMSIERWMSLVFPFKVKQMFFVRHPKAITWGTFIGMTIYLLPFVLRFAPFIRNKFNTDGLDAFVFIEASILHFAVPFIILVLNIMIIIAYNRFIRKRAASFKGKAPGGDTQSQRKITFVVLGVAALYIILTLPTVFIRIMMALNPEYDHGGKYEVTFKFFVEIGNFLAKVYAATDFFVYIMISKRYRQMFKELIFKGGIQKETMSSGTLSTTT